MEAPQKKGPSRRYEQHEDEDEEDVLRGEDDLEEVHQCSPSSPDQSSPEDLEFDRIVCALQDVLVSQQFEDLSDHFVRQHCHKFVETEENTHEMWLLHKQYKAAIENHLDREVKKAVPAYSQERFFQLLQGREDQIDEFVIDTVTGFDNFLDFKRLALETKLRQVRQEDPDQYRKLVAQHLDHQLLQEIAAHLEMGSALLEVKGLDQGSQQLDN